MGQAVSLRPVVHPPGKGLRVKRWHLFWCAALFINLVAFWMVHAIPKPAVSFGAAFDVAVTVPVLYFLLVVRAGLQPLTTMIPLCLLALLRASYLVPFPAATRPILSAGAEIAVVALVITRVRRGLGKAERGDVLQRLEAAALEMVPSRRLAGVLATEMAVFYYAFGAWRKRPEVPDGARAFTIHRQSGAAALFGMLAAVSMMEAALVHLVVMRWSRTSAWVLTALSAYGTIWLAAIARSFSLRPVLVKDGAIVVRSGLLWTAEIPAAIIEINREGPFDLKVPPASEPNLVLKLSQPVTARGMYGATRHVTSITLAIDDPDGFAAEPTSRRF